MAERRTVEFRAVVLPQGHERTHQGTEATVVMAFTKMHQLMSNSTVRKAVSSVFCNGQRGT
jgi:hypothetical protein